jgi:hypothetical protein
MTKKINVQLSEGDMNLIIAGLHKAKTAARSAAWDDTIFKLCQERERFGQAEKQDPLAGFHDRSGEPDHVPDGSIDPAWGKPKDKQNG